MSGCVCVCGCRHRDNVETRQVTWKQPLADEAVAIIGGGISGLACAQVGGMNQQLSVYCLVPCC